MATKSATSAHANRTTDKVTAKEKILKSIKELQRFATRPEWGISQRVISRNTALSRATVAARCNELKAEGKIEVADKVKIGKYWYETYRAVKNPKPVKWGWFATHWIGIAGPVETIDQDISHMKVILRSGNKAVMFSEKTCYTYLAERRRIE